MPWKYPLPTASPFVDAQQYVGLLLGIIDLELNRRDVWEPEEAEDALGYVQDLKQYIMLNFGESVSGGNMDYVRLSHTLPSNTGGGTATSGSFRTRPLNTKDIDSSNICTLSANEITLAPGTYNINALAVVFANVGGHKHRLWNVTDNTQLLLSHSGGSPTAVQNMPNILQGRFVLASTKTLRLEYRVSNTVSTNGLGGNNNYGVDEVYLVVELWRVAT